MNTFTMQVSNHPQAGSRIPTEAAATSWKTVYGGQAKAEDIRAAVDELSKWYRNVRSFRGKVIGKFYYAVYR